MAKKTLWELSSPKTLPAIMARICNDAVQSRVNVCRRSIRLLSSPISRFGRWVSTSRASLVVVPLCLARWTTVKHVPDSRAALVVVIKLGPLPSWTPWLWWSWQVGSAAEVPRGRCLRWVNVTLKWGWFVSGSGHRILFACRCRLLLGLSHWIFLWVPASLGLGVRLLGLSLGLRWSGFSWLV